MSEPIRNKRLQDVAAPTPQNTPASASNLPPRAQQPGLGSVKEEDFDRAQAAALLAGNPKLVSLIQNKLSGLVGQSSGYIESLPAPVRRRVAGLKGVQKDHAKLEAEFQEEVLQLEKKYHAKYTPLYEKRAAIIGGSTEPTDAEVAAGEADEEKDEEASKMDETTDDANVAGVPEFWLSAMKNNPSLVDLITEADEGALKHLTDIRMEYHEQPGFRLIFEFGPNDFFTNKTLSKSYFYKEENGYAGEFIYDHATGDKIDWKNSKDLTVKVESKRQRNKNTKQVRVVKKTVPRDSFFNFFSPPTPPSEEDEEIASDIEDRLELDYTLGEEIKEKLIPRAVDWFTGEALQFEGLGDMEDDEFEDEDDEDDDDLSEDRDEDDESEEDVDGPKAAKQDTAECKQS